MTEEHNSELEDHISDDELSIESGEDLPVWRRSKEERIQRELGSKQKRFYLFIGNLPYDANKEDVKEHFKMIGSTFSVKIPKERWNNKGGFVYMTVWGESAYNKALALHHSDVGGRRINVYPKRVSQNETPHPIQPKPKKKSAPRKISKEKRKRKTLRHKERRKAKKMALREKKEAAMAEKTSSTEACPLAS